MEPVIRFMDVVRLLPNGKYTATVTYGAATFYKSYWDQRDGENGLKKKHLASWQLFGEGGDELAIGDQTPEMQKLVKTFQKLAKEK